MCKTLARQQTAKNEAAHKDILSVYTSWKDKNAYAVSAMAWLKLTEDKVSNLSHVVCVQVAHEGGELFVVGCTTKSKEEAKQDTEHGIGPFLEKTEANAGGKAIKKDLLIVMIHITGYSKERHRVHFFPCVRPSPLPEGNSLLWQFEANGGKTPSMQSMFTNLQQTYGRDFKPSDLEFDVVAQPAFF
eukprot:TRINITY_DN66732_c4_g8_i1.p1 TRINITY_DN66732_c4_g8~~TRINITY_DN66732_c4_g8_i1.p1  ORF type:complete len:187 (+),score=23.07 TRINITY_DN66732_c4_g8_i1:535-1095(+)